MKLMITQTHTEYKYWYGI